MPTLHLAATPFESDQTSERVQHHRSEVLVIGLDGQGSGSTDGTVTKAGMCTTSEELKVETAA